MDWKLADQLLKKALVLMIFAWIALAILAVFMITAGTDETWILIGLRSALEPSVEKGGLPIGFTSGGLYAYVNLGLEKFFGSQVWIHRLFSLSCLLGLLLLVGSSLAAKRSSRPEINFIAMAPLIGIPGSAIVGTTALGTPVACFLLILAVILWTQSDSHGIGMAIFTGILLGLAAGSRMETILVLPALLVLGTLNYNEEKRLSLRFPGKEIIVTLVSVSVFLINLAVLYWLIPPSLRKDVFEANASATGISGGIFESLKDYPRLLNKMAIEQGFMPLFLLVLVSIFPFRKGWHGSSENRLNAVLILTGWLILLAWIAKSPIPHLRYLWPALVCFAVPAGISLSQLCQPAENNPKPFHSFLAIMLALAFVFSGLAETVRDIVLGDHDYLSWEWTGEMPLDYYRRFQSVKDQKDVCLFIKNLPGDSILFSDSRHILEYMTHRPVIEILRAKLDYFNQQKKANRSQSQYLVITPAVGTYWYFNPQAFIWLESKSRLAAQFGRYSVYEIVDDWPEDPQFVFFSRTNYMNHPLSKTWFGR